MINTCSLVHGICFYYLMLWQTAITWCHLTPDNYCVLFKQPVLSPCSLPENGTFPVRSKCLPVMCSDTLLKCQLWARSRALPWWRVIRLPFGLWKQWLLWKLGPVISRADWLPWMMLCVRLQAVQIQSHVIIVLGLQVCGTEFQLGDCTCSKRVRLIPNFVFWPPLFFYMFL